jgi:hypothetical protein
MSNTTHTVHLLLSSKLPRLLAVMVAAGTLLGTTMTAGAQPLNPGQLQPSTPAVSSMFFNDDWVNALAANLNLPVETVRSALEQTAPPPPTGPGQLIETTTAN